MTSTDDPTPQTQSPDASLPRGQRSAYLLRREGRTLPPYTSFRVLNFAPSREFQGFDLDLWGRQAYPPRCRGFEVVETGWS